MEHVYLAEFMVHEGTTRLACIPSPALSIQFLDFPALTVQGTFSRSLVFGKGKACKFSMTRTDLLKFLRTRPLELMLVDADNVRLVGAAALDLSVLASRPVPSSTEFKRNTVQFFDQHDLPIANIDLSVSISAPNEYAEPKNIFREVVPETLVKLAREDAHDKAVGTDPVLPVKPPTAEQGTVTEGKQEESVPLIMEYQPPPMILAKSRGPQPRPKVVVTQTPASKPASLVEQLIQEIQLLKAGRQPVQREDPQSFQFTNPKPTYQLQTKAAGGVAVAAAPVRRVMQQSIEQSGYSDDFEEDMESHMLSQSSEKLIRCFVCGDMVKVSEAGQHKSCRRWTRGNMLSPREEIEISQSYRDNRSIATSIIEEYSSDFENDSYR